MLKKVILFPLSSLTIGCFGMTNYIANDYHILIIEYSFERLYDWDKEITDFEKLEHDREYEDYTYYLSGADVFNSNSIFQKLQDSEYVKTLESKYPNSSDSSRKNHEVALFFGFRSHISLEKYENIESIYNPNIINFKRNDVYQKRIQTSKDLAVIYGYSRAFIGNNLDDENNKERLTYKITLTSKTKQIDWRQSNGI